MEYRKAISIAAVLIALAIVIPQLIFLSEDTVAYDIPDLRPHRTVEEYPAPTLFHPPRNSHTAPPTTTVSITYDEPISAAKVTSRTFAVHGVQ